MDIVSIFDNNKYLKNKTQLNVERFVRAVSDLGASIESFDGQRFALYRKSETERERERARDSEKERERMTGACLYLSYMHA